MHLETILNACYKLKGFVYTQTRRKVLKNDERIIAVQIRPRKKSKAVAFFVKNPPQGMTA